MIINIRLHAEEWGSIDMGYVQANSVTDAAAFLGLVKEIHPRKHYYCFPEIRSVEVFLDEAKKTDPPQLKVKVQELYKNKLAKQRNRLDHTNSNYP